MKNINFFPDNSDVKNKNVLLRLDLNVPMKQKSIQDYTRISLCLPLIESLIQKKAKIIILSHLGRPNGQKVPELSLAPIYKYLKNKLKTNVYFFTGDLDHDLQSKLSYQKAGEVILFENIRFFKEEEENDELFSKKLASICDIYINDAFSCSHRKQASIHKITEFAKSAFAGPMLKKEIESINLVIENQKKPVTCIIGGSKISTKINVINSLIKKVDNLIIVGAMANNFFAFKGLNIGRSLVEQNMLVSVEKIIINAKNSNCEIEIPVDCKVGKEFTSPAKIKDLKNIKSEEMILDIGPKTIEKICNIIYSSNTVMWNGPAGFFENENFLDGTLSIAKKISDDTENKNLISVLGGGDTISAINKSDKKLNFTHLSTAGGAFLEYIEGKDLPGLSVLK
tara:strand:+ start:151 stop:1341 length:1191 start_codon:yes stop_codon:yes gene_type:complete